jgi:ACR3 family arsenite efflux pump ArsB
LSSKEPIQEKKGLGFFEKYLTLWVAACIIVGVAIGRGRKVNEKVVVASFFDLCIIHIWV